MTVWVLYSPSFYGNVYGVFDTEEKARNEQSKLIHSNQWAKELVIVKKEVE